LQGFKVTKGDLITTSEQSGIVTKTTQNYIYYHINQYNVKMKRETLWSAFDTRDDVKIHYGKLKYRRLQRKMRTLNLHGTKHTDADNEIRKFLNFVELPCKIITGKSNRMKKFVKQIVSEYDWSCHEESAHNPGTLIIVEE
tara:strand:- start:198 stop:620 length:423 start_codon:yes stop_codon:yes gene_type:complete